MSENRKVRVFGKTGTTLYKMDDGKSYAVELDNNKGFEVVIDANDIEFIDGVYIQEAYIREVIENGLIEDFVIALLMVEKGMDLDEAKEVYDEYMENDDLTGIFDIGSIL